MTLFKLALQIFTIYIVFFLYLILWVLAIANFKEHTTLTKIWILSNVILFILAWS